MMTEGGTQKPHHLRDELCTSRSKYREGRKLKAIKVYTINLETKYLLVQGVPSVGAQEDLIKLFAAFGAIEEYQVLHEYPCEEFTEVYWIKYKDIQHARIAKRKLDDYSFLGGILHICYAPEYESVSDTKEKLQERRKAVARRIRSLGVQSGNATHSPEEQSKTGLQLQIDVGSQAAREAEWRFSGTEKGSHVNQLSAMTGSNPALPQLPPWSSHPTNSVPQHVTQYSSQSQPGLSLLPPPLSGPLPVGETMRGPAHSSSNHPAVYSYHYQSASSYSPGNLDLGAKKQCAGAPSSGSQKVDGKCVAKIGKVTNTNQSKSSSHCCKEPIVIKEYKVKKLSIPKFVPRQLTKTGEKMGSEQRPDPVNMKLKKSALVLEEMKGPSLPAEEKRRHELFKKSEMGDPSLDETTYEIRTRLLQVTEKTLPPPKKQRTG